MDKAINNLLNPLNHLKNEILVSTMTFYLFICAYNLMFTSLLMHLLASTCSMCSLFPNLYNDILIIISIWVFATHECNVVKHDRATYIAYEEMQHNSVLVLRNTTGMVSFKCRTFAAVAAFPACRRVGSHHLDL